MSCRLKGRSLKGISSKEVNVFDALSHVLSNASKVHGPNNLYQRSQFTEMILLQLDIHDVGRNRIL